MGYECVEVFFVVLGERDKLDWPNWKSKDKYMSCRSAVSYDAIEIKCLHNMKFMSLRICILMDKFVGNFAT